MAHVEKIRFSRTIQLKQFHPISYEEIVSLTPEDNYEAEKNGLINRVNSQANIELQRHGLAESIYDLQCQQEDLSNDLHRIQLQVDALRQQREELNQEMNELRNQKQQLTQPVSLTETSSEDEGF